MCLTMCGRLEWRSLSAHSGTCHCGPFRTHRGNDIPFAKAMFTNLWAVHFAELSHHSLNNSVASAICTRSSIAEIMLIHCESGACWSPLSAIPALANAARSFIGLASSCTSHLSIIFRRAVITSMVAMLGDNGVGL